jgi:hypothetical protein
MNIDFKTILPYIVIIASISMSWGMGSQRLDALEQKVNSIAQMQQDIAVIKEKIMWIESYLIKER